DPAVVLPRARATVKWLTAAGYGGWPSDAPTDEGTWSPDGADTTIRWVLLAEPSVGSLYRITVDRPFVGDPTLRWHDTVMVGAQGERAFAFVQASLHPTVTALTGTVSYQVRPPRSVAALVEQLDVRDSGRRMVLGPLDLT